MTTTAVFGFFVLPGVLFALAYFPAEELTRGLVSPYAKADLGKRRIAAAVDGLLLITSWYVYQRSESAWFLLAGAAYLLLRDAVRGQSAGKFFCGLVVVRLDTGRPCTLAGAVQRNLLFLCPGVNLVAVFLETITIARDPQGQRLGDRWAQTQVIEGLGARDLAAAFLRWWRRFTSNVEPVLRKPRRRPVGVELHYSTPPEFGLRVLRGRCSRPPACRRREAARARSPERMVADVQRPLRPGSR